MTTIRAMIIATLLALALAAATTSSSAVAATTTTPRASLSDIEMDVMCVSCHEPLALAQSPQAESERAYIRGLIAQGMTKPQIERRLVAQYGPSVLGKPPAHGFNLTVYVVPPALLLAGAAILLIALPRWRRKARASAAEPHAAAPSLSSTDARRLNEDLARFD